MIKIVVQVSVIAAIITVPITGWAQEKSTYKSTSDIPAYLRNNAQQGVYIEQYIYTNLQLFRQNVKKKSYLDVQDIQAIEEKEISERKRRQVQQLITYDQNFDGQVERDEIKAYHKELTQGRQDDQRNQQDYLNKLIDDLMQYDLDKDDIITLKEMSQLKENNPEHYGYSSSKNLSALMELDEDRDGKVTAHEIEVQSRAAFYTFDINKDDMLSSDEVNPIREAHKKIEMHARANQNCSLPTLPTDAKIVLINVTAGRATSTVSVAGQSNDTSAIRVQIDSGNEKLYIIASSFVPVIWQFSSDVSRIANVVLLGPASRTEGGKINAGVTGIPVEKVVFRSIHDCGFVPTPGIDRKGKEKGINLVKALTSRVPDYQLSQNYITGIRIFDGRINTDISEKIEQQQKQAPEGFDDNLWRHHLRFMPGGVIDFTKETVISDAKSEAYEVLPKWAGLAKLTEEKAIVPMYADRNSPQIAINNGKSAPLILENAESVQVNSATPQIEMMRQVNGFRIVKNIPYYPSGLRGGYSTKFFLPEGVIQPKGDPGHSDVKLEKTGEFVAGPGKDR